VSPSMGFACASLVRTYTLSNLASTTQFAIQLFDITTQTPTTYFFQIVRQASVLGDPMIYGIQGQEFQVHGEPDAIFNLISSPSVLVNARFVYLSAARCVDNATACFTHPGTYVQEEGLRIGSALKLRVHAGKAEEGLSVYVNDKLLSPSSDDDKVRTVKLQSESESTAMTVSVSVWRRVVIVETSATLSTPALRITIANSDMFLNQQLQVLDANLLAVGSKRTVLAGSQEHQRAKLNAVYGQDHADVKLHGLQGQTWRNIEYASGLEYEGSVMDYMVLSGNLFGYDFVFNHFHF